MLVEQLMVLSSIQIIIANKDDLIPVGFGSGCLIEHLNRKFLISVSHVTDNNLSTYIETNIPTKEKGTILKPIGGFCHFDIFKVSEGMQINEFEDLLKNPMKPLDISFAEIKEEIAVFQREIDFGAFKVEKGGKAILDLADATSPSDEYRYGFFGNVRQKLEGTTLTTQPTLKHNLRFHRTNKYFHMFLAPENISDSEDYEGCSGAPILANDGRIVALACMVLKNSRVIYGFSIEECIKLLNIAIETKLV